MNHPLFPAALLCLALGGISGCSSTPQLTESPQSLPIHKPSECLSPQLPSVQTMDERFDSLALADQAAMVANAVIVNEHRRHVAEAILGRCATWAASVR